MPFTEKILILYNREFVNLLPYVCPHYYAMLVKSGMPWTLFLQSNSHSVDSVLPKMFRKFIAVVRVDICRYFFSCISILMLKTSNSSSYKRSNLFSHYSPLVLFSRLLRKEPQKYMFIIQFDQGFTCVRRSVPSPSPRSF